MCYLEINVCYIMCRRACVMAEGGYVGDGGSGGGVWGRVVESGRAMLSNSMVSKEIWLWWNEMGDAGGRRIKFIESESDDAWNSGRLGRWVSVSFVFILAPFNLKLKAFTHSK